MFHHFYYIFSHPFFLSKLGLPPLFFLVLAEAFKFHSASHPHNYFVIRPAQFIFFSASADLHTLVQVIENGASVYVFPSFLTVYLFLKLTCLIFLSNYQGLPNSRCATFIGTSHKTSSLYLPTENEIKTNLITLTSPHSSQQLKLIQCILLSSS